MKPLNKKDRLLCVGLGEVLFDILPSGPQLGGAPANFAYAAQALGAQGLAVSAVGKDELGKKAKQLLLEKGLPAILPSVERDTGIVSVSFQGRGIPSYHFATHPAYEYIPYTEEIRDVAKKTDICCFGTLAQRGDVSRCTIQSFLQDMQPESFRVFDVNLRDDFYDQKVIETSLHKANAVKCNESELPVLCGLAGLGRADTDAYNEYLHSLGITCFMYTEGDRQSTVYNEGEISILPSRKVSVADTVGAGDAFTASIVTALAAGVELRVAHQLAVEVAAFLCTRHGAMPSFPDKYGEYILQDSEYDLG